MENPEILFEKIEAKEKEWAIMLNHLQSRSINMDYETRLKFETQMDNLNTRLKDIHKLNNRLRNASSEVRANLGDDLLHSWVESLVKIDNAVLTLKNRLG